MNAVYTDYADALFSLAAETGEDLRDDLRTVQEVFGEEPRYVEMLSSPAIPLDRRMDNIRQALEGRVSQTVCSFVQLLCQRGHIRLFSPCVDAYMEMDRAARRHTVAQVVSAVPLSDEQTARLTQKLTALSGRQVTLTCTVDPGLLGGITVRMDGNVLDGSIMRRLRDMKEVMDK